MTVPTRTRTRILDLLDGWEGTARTVAGALGTTERNARAHLANLERDGLITSHVEPTGRNGRPATVYTTTPTATPVDEPDLSPRDAALRALKAAIEQHPDLGAFLLDPTLPAADPTDVRGGYTISERGTKHPDRLDEAA